jgi:hypothetical protein
MLPAGDNSASAAHFSDAHRPCVPRISLITLAVDDLERSLAFYSDGLGFATQGIMAPSSR